MELEWSGLANNMYYTILIWKADQLRSLLSSHSYSEKVTTFVESFKGNCPEGAITQIKSTGHLGSSEVGLFVGVLQKYSVQYFGEFSKAHIPFHKWKLLLWKLQADQRAQVVDSASYQFMWRYYY